MLILIVARTPLFSPSSTSTIILSIVSLKLASHLCIHLFLKTPQFFLSLCDTSSVSSDLRQNWLRLLLGLRLLALLGRLPHVHLLHWGANNCLFDLSLLLIIFALFLLPGHHLLAFDTSLSQTGSLGKVIIPSLLSFFSGFLGSVPSSIIDDNDPILRHILVSTFSGLSTSSKLLLLIMLIQMLSKSLQVIELLVAVVTLKDSDASI